MKQKYSYYVFIVAHIEIRLLSMMLVVNSCTKCDINNIMRLIVKSMTQYTPSVQKEKVKISALNPK